MYQLVYESGGGFETVSPSEVMFVKNLFPGFLFISNPLLLIRTDFGLDLDTSQRILFTPNFVPRSEYEFGFDNDVIVTVDSLYPLQHWPETFSGRSIFLRIDPGVGKGHHEHVKTAGNLSKFGIPLDQIDAAADLAKKAGSKVVGLHAHAGSGLKEASHWKGVAEIMDRYLFGILFFFVFVLCSCFFHKGKNFFIIIFISSHAPQDYSNRSLTSNRSI